MLSNDIDHTFVHHVASLHGDVVSLVIVGYWPERPASSLGNSSTTPL